MAWLKRFLFDEDATAATEYAIMLSLLLLVIIVAATNISVRFNARFNAANTVL